jgi:transcriptional regulator with XRE-family HTH domain
VSRLEKGKVDPTLSSLRRLASALRVQVGQLVEQTPPSKTLGREEMDRLARGALHPGTKAAQTHPEVRILARLFHERRKALGLFVPKGKKPRTSIPSSAIHAAKWLRTSLGESQWKALLRRIDKLASGSA